MTQGRGQRRLLVLAPAAMAFLLFVTYLLQIRNRAFVEYLVANPLVYDSQAHQILRSVPPSQPFFLSPIYPAFVAAIYSLSKGSTLAVLMCQGILLAVNAGLIGMISARLFSKQIALASSVLMTFYWTYYYFAGEMLPTTLCLSFMLVGILLFTCRSEPHVGLAGTVAIAGAGVLFFVHAMPLLANLGDLLGGAALEAPARAYWATGAFLVVFAVGAVTVRRGGNLVASGLTLGISALVWSGTLAVTGLVLLRLLIGRTRGWAEAALFALGVIIPLAASLSHNYLISGDIIPVTSSFGVNFFIGNNASTDGMDPFRFGEGDRVRIEADRLALAGARRSAFFRDRALEFIKERPGDWARLAARKLLISIGRTEIDNNADISERRSAWRRFFVPVVHFGFIFPLAAVGMMSLWGGDRRAMILVLGYLGSLLVCVVFFACERFRLPGITCLLPLAAFGIQSLIDGARRRKKAKMAILIAVLIGAGAASNIDFLGIADTEFPSITVNKSYVERRDGNLEEARVLALMALEHEPRNAGAYFQLGAIQEARSDIRGALIYYIESLESDPFFLAAYRAARRILEHARMNTAYLDAYVDSIIDGGDSAAAKQSLLTYVERRLP